ncbi:MAG: histidinol-phosphate transaminase [Nitrospirae bacterium]|nr:histidinol-phosphate transaminase [Nitrospirota bacterium]
MLKYVSDNIKNLVPYQPGKPIEELERELGIKGVIKLASNENPLGASRKAIEAIKVYIDKKVNRYPDGGGFYLRRALAEKWGISQESVILGNGSNEIIELLIRTLVSPGDNAVTSENTFSVYRLIMTAANGAIITVPMKDERFDLKSMAGKINSRTRLVFIANPNNPTGTMSTAQEVRDFMKEVPQDVMVVFDEAYAEYVTSDQYPDSLGYLRDGRNVTILRTFSKIYGLAGLRIGYGLTTVEMADMMNRVRQPFNTNALAQVAALAALEDERHVEESRRINGEGKEYLYKEFESMGIRYIPTEANFIYFRADDGRAIFDAMLKEGIIIRHMGGRDLRVTIGLPEENRKFTAALRKVLGII